MCTLWTSLLNLSIPDVPFPVLLSTLIRSRFQAKPATLQYPINYSFPFCGGEALRYSVPKWLLFLIVGSGFHCLRSFFLFVFSRKCIPDGGFTKLLDVKSAWLALGQSSIKHLPGLADALFFQTGFIQCCNVANSVVPFSILKVFCKCYNKHFSQFSTYYIRSRASWLMA